MPSLLAWDGVIATGSVVCLIVELLESMMALHVNKGLPRRLAALRTACVLGMFAEFVVIHVLGIRPSLAGTSGGEGFYDLPWTAVLRPALLLLRYRSKRRGISTIGLTVYV